MANLNSTNYTNNPELRFKLIPIRLHGYNGTLSTRITSIAKIVEYQGYSADDPGLYISQPVVEGMLATHSMRVLWLTRLVYNDDHISYVYP